jgi:hypothetical protein
MFNFTARCVKIPGRISVGGYALDSQNKEMLEIPEENIWVFIEVLSFSCSLSLIDYRTLVA